MNQPINFIVAVSNENNDLEIHYHPYESQYSLIDFQNMYNDIDIDSTIDMNTPILGFDERVYMEIANDRQLMDMPVNELFGNHARKLKNIAIGFIDRENEELERMLMFVDMPEKVQSELLGKMEYNMDMIQQINSSK